MPANNGHNRFDRIEANLEQLTGNVSRQNRRFGRAQQRHDGRADKLVSAIGKLIRRSDKA
jgi:uncharacterized protein YjbJ (UPF0337 family)